jgi:hypothetical protein
MITNVLAAEGMAGWNREAENRAGCLTQSSPTSSQDYFVLVAPFVCIAEYILAMTLRCHER